jgi:hypothetical protein
VDHEPVAKASEPKPAAADVDCPTRAAKEQYDAGWRKFQEYYMGDEATPDQRNEYVDALADIFGAGFRGHDEARNNFPGVAEMLDAEKLSDELQQPLDEIPREWVEEAFALALACKPPA